MAVTKSIKHAIEVREQMLELVPDRDKPKFRKLLRELPINHHGDFSTSHRSARTRKMEAERWSRNIEFAEAVICRNFNTTMDEIKSRSRKQNIVFARFLMIWFSRTYFPLMPFHHLVNRYERKYELINHAMKSIDMVLDDPRYSTTFKKTLEEIEMKMFYKKTISQNECV